MTQRQAVSPTRIVRKIRSGRGNVLVEWVAPQTGTLKRGWIPDNLIDEDLRVSARTLASAMPYGFPIEAVLKDITIEAGHLSQALHKRGVWTEEDFKNNPAAIQKALLEAVGQSVSKIQTLVREAKFEETPQAKDKDRPEPEENQEEIDAK